MSYKWIFEKKLQRIKAEKNISFAEARNAAAGENENRPSFDTRTVAEVVRLRSEPAPPATRSIETLTELTWSDNQETPTTAPTSTCTSQTSHTKQSQTSTQISIAMTSTSAAANSPVRPNRRGHDSWEEACPQRSPFQYSSSFWYSGDNQIFPSKGKQGAAKTRKINLNRPLPPSHGRSGHYI